MYRCLYLCPSFHLVFWGLLAPGCVTRSGVFLSKPFKIYQTLSNSIDTAKNLKSVLPL